MDKKRYIKPEMEVTFMKIDTIIMSSFGADVTNPDGTRTTSEDEITTGGETNKTSDVPAPIFFPDLD